MLEIISSIDECWNGIDATNFINNSKEYLDNLERDLKKVEEWSKYFNKSALKYSDGVSEGLKQIRDTKNRFQVGYVKERDFNE